MATNNNPNPPATTQAPAQQQPAQVPEFDVEAMLRRDPFAAGGSNPPPSQVNPGDPAAPAEANPQQTQLNSNNPAPAAAVPNPATQSPAAEDPNLALLRTQLAERDQEINRLRTPIQQPQAPQQPQSGYQGPEFNFQVPPNLLAAIYSEDPLQRTQGLSAMMQGVARATFQTVMGQVQRYYTEQVPAAIREAQANQAQAQQVHQDFYSSFPELSKPELRMLVLGTAQQLIAETGAKSWTPQLKAALGQRVKAVLGMGTPAATPVPVVPPTRIPGTNGARVGDQRTTQERDIAETLFG